MRVLFTGATLRRINQYMLFAHQALISTTGKSITINYNHPVMLQMQGPEVLYSYEAFISQSHIHNPTNLPRVCAPTLSTPGA